MRNNCPMRKTRANRDRSVKKSVSFPADMAAWLDRSARQRRVSVSHIIQQSMLPTFEARHKA